MKVTIKDFDVGMEVKTNGIEFQVRKPNGELLGDCYLTKTGLIWCKGQTQRQNGVKASWNEFILWMESD
ncbi:MAG: hypothetical protein J0H31_04190 [Alphaproteobacteria bacterium]|nr:hypothetical protein [Alphaproteobacteria bacterium]